MAVKAVAVAIGAAVRGSASRAGSFASRGGMSQTSASVAVVALARTGCEDALVAWSDFSPIRLTERVQGFPVRYAALAALIGVIVIVGGKLLVSSVSVYVWGAVGGAVAGGLSVWIAARSRD